MAISFEQKLTIQKIADLMYDFLPASGSNVWKGFVTFGTIAQELGLSDFWMGGSKKPAIIRLLVETYDKRANQFESLIKHIVLASYTYRKRKKNPLSRNEIFTLNDYLLKLNFKFPDLHNPAFLDSLVEEIKTSVEKEEKTDLSLNQYRIELSELKMKYSQLIQKLDRHQAGFELEKLLNKLFDISDLHPRSPFKIIGEQIDGSIEVDNNLYIIEIKWTKHAIDESDLLIFRGKVEAKSSFTRGIFISINGFTPMALKAIVTGKQPNFFLIDGYDLYLLFEEAYSILDLLKCKIRKLAEEGSVFVRFNNASVMPQSFII